MEIEINQQTSKRINMTDIHESLPVCQNEGSQIL